MNSLKDELANAKPFLHAYEVSPFFNNAFRSLDSHIMVKTSFIQNTALATSSKKFTIFNIFTYKVIFLMVISLAEQSLIQIGFTFLTILTSVYFANTLIW